MASGLEPSTTLRQFDIYMPYEVIEKCFRFNKMNFVEKNKDNNRGIMNYWSANVQDLKDIRRDQQQQTEDGIIQDPNSMTQENKGFDRLNCCSENVQIANIATSLSPQNMLMLSFSRVKLKVLEGHCAFKLSDIQKDKMSHVMPSVHLVEEQVENVSENYHDEIKCTELKDNLNTLIPTRPSLVVDSVNYDIENNTSKSTENIDFNSVDLNISTGSDSALLESVSCNSLPKEMNEVAFHLCDVIESTEKERLYEKELDEKQIEKFNFQPEIDFADKLEEFFTSPTHRSGSIDFSKEKFCDNDRLPQSRSVSQKKDIAEIKTFSPKAKDNLCSPVIQEEMIKVVDDSGIPKKQYMLRGVKLPKSLIEQEKKSNQKPQRKSGFKNTKLKNAKSSYTEIKNCLSKTNKTNMSANENPASPSSMQLMPKKQPTEIPVDYDKPKRRKRNNTRIVECRYCKKMFCDYTGVDEHVKKFHSKESDFDDYIADLKKLKAVVCNKCNVTLLNRYLLQEHENRVHAMTKSEVCSICGKKYKNLKSLRNHLRFVHYAKDKAHLCHLCPAKFKWAGTLKQHIQEIHEQSSKFSCPTCNKEFSRKSQLNRHVRIHGSDASKRITCDLCNKGFWYENNYVRHMKVIHQPQFERFHCSYCGKGFNQKASMVAHVQLMHLKIYTYSCKICKAGFTRSKLLQVHMAQVHNDKEFVVEDRRQGRFKYRRTPADLLYCHYCNQSFFYKAQVVEHIHQEHTFPHRCESCKQGFLLKKYLDKHLRKAHNIEVEINADYEEETDNVEKVLENLLELNSNLPTPTKCVTESVTGLENSEEISRETFLLSPNNDCYENLLHEQSTSDTYEVMKTSTSLLLEVAKDDGTIHYFIQQDEKNNKENQLENDQQFIHNT